MSITGTVLNAIAFIPVANPLDGIYAQQCITHIERRGYRLFAILRHWEQVMEVLGTREAQVIVMARREHLDPDFVPRIEFVGGETQELTRNAPDYSKLKKGGSRSRRPNVVN